MKFKEHFSGNLKSLGFVLILLYSIQGFSASRNGLNCNLSLRLKALGNSSSVTNHQKLMNYGYTESVANRILTDRPDIAARIIELQKNNDPKGRALTLYRGIYKEPKDFVPVLNEIPASPTGIELAKVVTWYGFDVSYSAQYAALVGMNKGNVPPRFSTIIEYQIPEFLGVKSHQVSEQVFKEFITQATDIPDARPYISRVGIIDLKAGPKFNKNWTEQDVQWFDYEEIFKNGIPVNPSVISP